MEQSNAPVVGIRPTFLTVLCILTWIGVAISVVTNLIAWMAVGAVSAIKDGAYEGAINYADSTGVAMSESTTAANATADAALSAGSTIFIIGIISALICLIGSIMMWKLKKTGFYIYSVANIIPVIAAAVLLGGTAFSGGMAILGMILPVAFIVMYGMNLKHMR